MELLPEGVVSDAAAAVMREDGVALITDGVPGVVGDAWVSGFDNVGSDDEPAS